MKTILEKGPKIKNRIVLIAVIFIIFVGVIKCVDITIKYEVSILEFFKYSTSLSYEEKTLLKSKEILYGIDINDAPFAFVSSDSKQNTGILVDYFNQLSVALESNMQAVSDDSYNLAVKLKSGEIDAAVLNMTPINKQVFLFTQPLYTERSKILVVGDSKFEKISDVSDISIAVIAGTTAHHAANSFYKNNTSVKFVLTDSMDESFYLLGMGEVDGILGDEAKISYHLNQAIKNNRFKFLEGSVYEEEVAVAVNKDRKELCDILNKGILNLKKTNQYNHIHSKWFGSFIPEVKDIADYSMTANVIIFILSIAFIMLIWNQTVSNRVNLKTRELSESRAELRSILDSLMDGIIVTDSVGDVQVCNKTAHELIGEKNKELIDENIYRIGELEPYLYHANRPEAFQHGNKYYLISKRELDGVSGKNIVVIEDYTERHKYESLTRQEAKMVAVGELSAGLAHEIRNPLGLIKSYIYVIRKRLSGDVENHAVEVIDASVDRINNLIDNLLGFSRLSKDKSMKVDVEKLILSIIALQEKSLEKSGIKICLNFNMDKGKMLTINEDVLKLLIVNLINNSVDALKKTEKIEKNIVIAVTNMGNKLKIDFKDNGIGIPKENLETIFNPFFTTKETGTGLGLYIINSEIRNKAGQITVESVLGEGTTFHIILPEELDDERD